tara:strand:- start:8117 stop:8698 length:582 start_codon:yes stop_codon:yes gene_type:complete
MSNLINLYNDSESAIIIDEGSTTLTQVEKFPTLGQSPFNFDALLSGDASRNLQAERNLYFIELNVFDGDGALIVTLNSAKPLFKLPSTGKYYFGDYHYHDSGYMVGKKHTTQPHEGLIIEKQNQLIPYPIENKIYADDYQSTNKTFMIKTSEIFEILENLPNFSLTKNGKYSISYGVFQDVFLLIRNTYGSTS